MGEVYRARDPKLRRDVAIEVLPASFALDPERAARFEREARVLASLMFLGQAPTRLGQICYSFKARRDGRVVDGGGL